MSDVTLIEPTRLSKWNPKAWGYGIIRLALGSVGTLSKGISVGQRYGFDSGVMLDHVYNNKAEGVGWAGRAIDRAFLNSAGWQGIRARGQLLNNTIQHQLKDLYDGSPIRLADLACGGGQYVLDALQASKDIETDTILRDYRDENVRRAQRNAQDRGVKARLERADAFSDSDLVALGTRDLVIVSGLHEILVDDQLIRNHFRQIAKVLRPGGILLQTVQPVHPQLQLIAETLKTHTGQPWAMRLRSQDLICKWAEEAGLQLVTTEMERSGIFGLMTFRKPDQAQAKGQD